MARAVAGRRDLPSGFLGDLIAYHPPTGLQGQSAGRASHLWGDKYIGDSAYLQTPVTFNTGGGHYFHLVCVCYPQAVMQPAHKLDRLALLALGILLSASSCNKPAASEALFNQVMASSFALGIQFGQLEADVVAKLGEPDQEYEKQQGAYREVYYVAPDPNAAANAVAVRPGRFSPQLKLTFVGGKLAQVVNAYQVDDSKAPMAPKIAEVLAGVKIGARRSDLQQRLGKPLQSGSDLDEWRFAKGVQAVSLKVEYLHVEEAKAELAASVSLAVIADASLDHGEQSRRNQAAQDAIHK